MNRSNPKYLLIATALFILAGINDEILILDFVLGLGAFYSLSRYILECLTRNELFGSDRNYLITRFHLFLSVHAAVFILLFIFIDFDFFREKGDWHEYDFYARAFSATLSSEGINSGIGLAKASGYIKFVGYIYYFFGGIAALAIISNLFLLVMSSLIVFMLAREIFNRGVAVRAMYLSALFPLHFVTEIHLVKEPLLYFLFLCACLLLYRATFNNHSISKVLSIIVGALIVYVRVIYVIPLLVFVAYYYLFIDFKLRNVALILSVAGVGIIFLSNIDQSSFQRDSIQALMFSDGISMVDETAGEFNYQVNLSNPLQIVSIMLTHPAYYIERIAGRYFLALTGGTTLYRVPFLSYESANDAKLWAFDLMRFLTGIMMWLSIFVTLSGLKTLIAKHFQQSSIIWISLAIIPFINSLVGGNYRYQDTLNFLILICLAIGLENRVQTKWNMLAASIMGVGLIFFFAMGRLYSAKFMFVACILIGIHFLYALIKKRQPFRS